MERAILGCSSIGRSYTRPLRSTSPTLAFFSGAAWGRPLVAGRRVAVLDAVLDAGCSSLGAGSQPDSRRARSIACRLRARSRSLRATRSPPEAPPSLGIRPQGAKEVHLTEVRPVRVGKVVLGMGRLPQQEAGQPDLAGGADDQVGVGDAGGVQVAGDLVGGDHAGGLAQLQALVAVLGQQPADGVGDLL